MAVRMAGLNRLPNGQFFARKVIPVDVRDAYERLYGVRWEAHLKLPADTSKHEAKTRHGEWLAEIETRIATLRATAKGEGQPLTRLNAIALAALTRWCGMFCDLRPQRSTRATPRPIQSGYGRKNPRCGPASGHASRSKRV